MDEIKKTQEERKKMEQQIASLTSVTFDTDLYGGGDNRFDGYVQSIAVNPEDDDNQGPTENAVAKKLSSFTAPSSIMNEMPRGSGEDEDYNPGFKKSQRITDREDDYRKRQLILYRILITFNNCFPFHPLLHFDILNDTNSLSAALKEALYHLSMLASTVIEENSQLRPNWH